MYTMLKPRVPKINKVLWIKVPFHVPIFGFKDLFWTLLFLQSDPFMSVTNLRMMHFSTLTVIQEIPVTGFNVFSFQLQTLNSLSARGDKIKKTNLYPYFVKLSTTKLKIFLEKLLETSFPFMIFKNSDRL